MSALPNDIAAATREAIIERYENTAVRDALTGARDGSLLPAEGFFDLLANAKTVVDERGLVLAGDPRFSVSVAALVWSDPSVATPAVRLVDAEQSVDAKLCCSRIELDLEDESTSFELFYAPDVDQTPPPTGPVPLWISPNGDGDLSGSDAANAGRLSQLNSFISRAALTGAQVWMRADAGSYNFTSTLTLTNGGTTVRGVDVNGNPMSAEFVGKRLVDPDRSHIWNAKADSAAGIYGIEVFRLNTGADNLTFSNLAFRNLGRGCFRARQAIRNLTLTDITATNVAAFFVNDAGVTAEGATITGLTMQRCIVRGFSKFFAKIQWNSTDILVEDCIGDSEKQDGDNCASGLVFDDNASNAIIRRVTMGNIIDSLHNYQNGDAFSGERGNRNLRFEDCLAHNCTDGGWDFKGDDIVMIRCVSRENHRNYRLWGMADLYYCEGYDQRADNAAPRPPKPFSKAQLSVFYGALVRAFNCRFEQSSTTTGEPFRAEQGGIMVLDQATLNATKVPSGTPLYAIEPAGDGKPEAKIITMPAVIDTTPPVISMATDFSVDENIATGWIITANETAQLRILPGKDAARFSNYGWKLNIGRQDYEKLENKTLFVDIVLYDIFKNVSAVRTVTVAIGNVADDPISATDLFVTGTYTEGGVYRPPAARGAWLTIEPGFVWQDVEMTIPAAQEGDLIQAITDQSGKGLHALQPDASFAPALRIVEGVWSAYMDNCYWDIGKPGDINFPQVTAVVMIKRDPQEVVSTTNKIVLHTPRSLNPTTAFNASWWIAVQSGATFAIRLNGSTNAGTQNVGIGTKRALTIQTLNGYGRVNAGAPPQIDSIDVASNPYPVVGQGRLGADFNGRNGLFGDFYGTVITDRDEQFEEVFRLNRQLTAIAGTTLG